MPAAWSTCKVTDLRPGNIVEAVDGSMHNVKPVKFGRSELIVFTIEGVLTYRFDIDVPVFR